MKQVALENRMVFLGHNRSLAAFNDAEQTGHAERTPYVQSLLRTYVESLAELVAAGTTRETASIGLAHARLLTTLDPWAVAYIAVRTALALVLQGTNRHGEHTNLRILGHEVGRNVYTELILSQFKELSPDLYHVLTQDLHRRQSTDVKHRLATFKAQAATHGVKFATWPVGAVDQVGLWLIDQMRLLKLIELGPMKTGPGKRWPVDVYVTPEIQDMVDQMKEHCSYSRPMYMPCVYKPLPWDGLDGGGFHTPEMQRRLPYFVAGRTSVRERLLKNAPLTMARKSINALQSTRWQVNGKILDIATVLSKTLNRGEIKSGEAPDKPYPIDLPKKGRTAVQNSVLDRWKGEMREWYTANRLHKTGRARIGTALRIAQEFRHDDFWFVHFCDSQGRMYPSTTGISPQGSDLQRALIKFHKGERVWEDKAQYWFRILGANKFGFDTAPLDERAAWPDANWDMILECACNPTTCLAWMDADKPFQFLAWCMEYVNFRQSTHPETFLSYLPVGLDGSCSGLQHFSAMLRDEVGAEATNLIPSELRQDIYGRVAKATQARIEADHGDTTGMRLPWLQTGVTRTHCKRITMCTPYNLSKDTGTKYVRDEHVVNLPIFPRSDQFKAAMYFTNHAWAAIAEVVVAARAGMEWLGRAARTIVKNGQDVDGTIHWETPSKFIASQTYNQVKQHRINTHIYGLQKIKVLSEIDEAHANDHVMGLAPNFVHSYDAAHMHATINAISDVMPGVSLSMIHDDFGTHAAHTQLMYKTVREEFVGMYIDCDPLEDFRQQYEIDEPIPPKGTFDIRQVINAPYAFS